MVLGRGNLLNARKVITYIEELRGRRKGLQKVLACIDCEDYSLSEVRNDVSRTLAEIQRYAPPLIPDYVVIVHALEAWTGADENALRIVLRPSPRRYLRAITESDPRPKQTLRRLFRQNGRDFRGTRDNPRLAEIVDLVALRRNNSSFAEFEQRVRE